MVSKADRFNEGKPRMDLIPLYALEEIGKVYDYGTHKYDDHNWRKGLDWNQGCAASLLRHLTKWQDGEELDEESGLPHDVHIAWNAITLVAMRLKNEGTDDRFKSPDKDLSKEEILHQRLRDWGYVFPSLKDRDEFIKENLK